MEHAINKATCVMTILTMGLLILYAVYVITYYNNMQDIESGGCKIITPTVFDGGDVMSSSRSSQKQRHDRFNLTNARANVRRPVSAMMDDNFRRYKFDIGRATGVHGDWDVDESVLINMCEMMTEGLRYVHYYGGGAASKTAAAVATVAEQNARLMLAVTENFIYRFKLKLDSIEPKPLRKVPWGSTDDVNDARAFTIDIPCMLAHYLLLGQRAAMKREAVDLILILIQSPYSALGTKFTKRSVILQMVGPWILAKYLKGEGDATADTAEYRNVTDLAEVAVQHSNTDRGTHMDHSFYDGELGVFYWRLYNDKTSYYYGFDTNLVHTRVDEWNAIRSILLHPTVMYGNVGLLNRRRELHCETYDKSKYGVRVMPFSGYIRYFTKDRQFSVRAQKKHLAYYEADRGTDDMAQYWVQYRNVHSATGTNVVPKYPDIGFVNRASQRRLLELPIPNVYGGDTHIYKPTKAKSFVVAYKQYGVMYQEYEIAEFGDFAVFEFIVINTATKVVDVKLKIVNRESTELNYYGAKTVKHVVPAFCTRTYTTTMNMKNGATETRALADFPSFPYTLNTGLSIKDVNNLKSYILYENGVPVIWMPYDWSYELPNLVYTVGNMNEAFIFDTNGSNQYTNVKYTGGGGGGDDDDDDGT